VRVEHKRYKAKLIYVIQPIITAYSSFAVEVAWGSLWQWQYSKCSWV